MFYVSEGGEFRLPDMGGAGVEAPRFELPAPRPAPSGPVILREDDLRRLPLPTD